MFKKILISLVVVVLLSMTLIGCTVKFTAEEGTEITAKSELGFVDRAKNFIVDSVGDLLGVFKEKLE